MKTALKKIPLFIFILLGTHLFALAQQPLFPECPKQVMRNMMKNILLDNQKFMTDPRYNDGFFRKQAAGQHPRMTIIACADSRVHTSNFDFHPLGDVFFIRNIGNQLETCLGSVDYGILHLHTPLLVFLGHSKCGAITAATIGLGDLEESIQNELAPISITHRTPNPTDRQIAENVNENVRDQVNKACDRYEQLIGEEKLWVVGGVYDFTPEGAGSLHLIQVNRQTDPCSIGTFLEGVKIYGDYSNDPGRVPSER